MAIPKEPRQMMINMMYLVLTALLALNVSKEIIKAFNLIENSLDNSTKNIVQKNTAVLGSLVKTASENKAAAAAVSYCNQVQVISKTLIVRLNGIKNELLLRNVTSTVYSFTQMTRVPIYAPGTYQFKAHFIDHEYSTTETSTSCPSPPQPHSSLQLQLQRQQPSPRTCARTPPLPRRISRAFLQSWHSARPPHAHAW